MVHSSQAECLRMNQCRFGMLRFYRQPAFRILSHRIFSWVHVCGLHLPIQLQNRIAPQRDELVCET